MSDNIKHECGIALVRLLKPLSYYREKYGTPTWGMDRLQLLMLKQRNRGQDGAGVACVKSDMPMGIPYMIRHRTALPGDPSQVVFDEIHTEMHDIFDDKYASWTDGQLKEHFSFLGELYLGHLRYGTHGDHTIAACHPHVRQNNWSSRAIALAGNFNLTNADVIFCELVEYGMRPVGVADNLTLLEKIGHFLDKENNRVYRLLKKENPHLQGTDLAKAVSKAINIDTVLKYAAKDWDGGYVLAGLIGNGDAFVCRDPNGIRPVYYYQNDEVVAVASERVAITTVFNLQSDQVKPIKPGYVLSIKHKGLIEEKQITEPRELTHCSFERIYFSRGNDPDIYRERKSLGHNLAVRTLQATKSEIENIVFSFIPNTAETAFLGLVEEVGRIIREQHAVELWDLHSTGKLTKDDIKRLVNGSPRVEKAAHKDQKIRTFITQDRLRSDLVSHVYDITRESIKPDDTLVILDDSIVRGTTLRESILTMLTRLNPQRIVVVSSAPPICYPDCYGIDMSELGRFIAFQAAVHYLQQQGNLQVVEDIYEKCKAQVDKPVTEIKNYVKEIYDAVSLEDLSKSVAHLVRPRNVDWDGELVIVYQTIAGLRKSLPKHTGDWYFTGNYPTPGGYRVLNTAFINYYENRVGRSY